MDYMKQALNLAKNSMELGEIPVGCVIVHNVSGKIIAQTYNRCEIDNNPLHHAEMLAIDIALRELGQIYLNNCSMYVTLEPCLMCCGALGHVHLDKLYFGAYDSKSGAVEHTAEVFRNSRNLYSPSVIGGIYEQSCANLLKTFFKQHRIKKHKFLF